MTLRGAATLSRTPLTVNVYLVTLRHPGDPAAMARLKREFPGVVLPAVPPPEVREVHGVNDLPLALATVLTLLAVGTIAHTLVTSVRRRRRDLAILKAVGFVGREVRASVAWQATAIAGAGLIVGLPLGVAAGRWAWTALAGAFAIEPVPSSPGAAARRPGCPDPGQRGGGDPRADRGASPARRGAQDRIAVPRSPLAARPAGPAARPGAGGPGKMISMSRPPAGRAAAPSRAPCARAMHWTMARPSPCPPLCRPAAAQPLERLEQPADLVRPGSPGRCSAPRGRPARPAVPVVTSTRPPGSCAGWRCRPGWRPGSRPGSGRPRPGPRAGGRPR